MLPQFDTAEVQNFAIFTRVSFATPSFIFENNNYCIGIWMNRAITTIVGIRYGVLGYEQKWEFWNKRKKKQSQRPDIVFSSHPSFQFHNETLFFGYCCCCCFCAQHQHRHKAQSVKDLMNPYCRNRVGMQFWISKVFSSIFWMKYEINLIVLIVLWCSVNRVSFRMFRSFWKLNDEQTGTEL